MANAGYLLTAVCVPALALTPFLGGAGLAVTCARYSRSVPGLITAVAATQLVALVLLVVTLRLSTRRPSRRVGA